MLRAGLRQRVGCRSGIGQVRLSGCFDRVATVGKSGVDGAHRDTLRHDHQLIAGRFRDHGQQAFLEVDPDGQHGVGVAQDRHVTRGRGIGMRIAAARDQAGDVGGVARDVLRHVRQNAEAGDDLGAIRLGRGLRRCHQRRQGQAQHDEHHRNKNKFAYHHVENLLCKVITTNITYAALHCVRRAGQARRMSQARGPVFPNCSAGSSRTGRKAPASAR